jgi:4-aminobutyrate aminotransferase-like enzyme
MLVGSTGPQRNILKVRPPLAFTTKHIASFITAWTSAVGD